MPSFDKCPSHGETFCPVCCEEHVGVDRLNSWTAEARGEVLARFRAQAERAQRDLRKLERRIAMATGRAGRASGRRT